MKWIEIKTIDDLPPQRVRVFVSACDDTVFICSLYICLIGKSTKYVWEDDNGQIVNHNDILAWMPLPSPFKKLSKGGNPNG